MTYKFAYTALISLLFVTAARANDEVELFICAYENHSKAAVFYGDFVEGKPAPVMFWTIDVKAQTESDIVIVGFDPTNEMKAGYDLEVTEDHRTLLSVRSDEMEYNLLNDQGWMFTVLQNGDWENPVVQVACEGTDLRDNIAQLMENITANGWRYDTRDAFDPKWVRE